MESLLRPLASRVVSVAYVASAVCFATALLALSGAAQAQQAAAELVIHNGLIVNDSEVKHA